MRWVFADEIHVTIPPTRRQCFRGDFRRKATLAEYGFFRLPSCIGQPGLAIR